MNIRVMLTLSVLILSIPHLKSFAADTKESISSEKQINNAPEGFRKIKWGVNIYNFAPLDSNWTGTLHGIKLKAYYNTGKAVHGFPNLL